MADNERRWGAIGKEIGTNLISDFTCLEPGSNFGFMSLKLASTFPNSRVFSIEGSFGTGNSGSTAEKSVAEIEDTEGVRAHRETRDELGLWNDIVCCGLVTADTYKRLRDRNVQFDYQISLSVFHWIVDASHVSNSQSRALLADHLRVAKVTFLELPAMEQSRALPGIYTDYSTIPEAITEVCKEHGVTVRITYLCSSKWYGSRETYRVDVIADGQGQGFAKRTCDEIISALGVSAAAPSLNRSLGR